MLGPSSVGEFGPSPISQAPAPEHTPVSTSNQSKPRAAGPDRRRARGARRLLFGDFEFEPSTRELRGPNGTARLQPQPARLLELLLENSGVVVSREKVRRRLWADEVHVEFDQGMNTCVKRIRSALNDSAEAPRYVETLPRLGYRFLAPVGEAGPTDGLWNLRGGNRRYRFRFLLAAVLTTVGLTTGVLAWSALTAPPCDDERPEVASDGSTPGRPSAPAKRGRPPNP